MFDTIRKIGNSMIHYGKNSNRVYLMSLDSSDLPNIIDEMNKLAVKNSYTKIVAKVPVTYKKAFETDGFITEAFIPKFYQGKIDGCFLCKFFSEDRKTDMQMQKYNEIIEIAKQKEFNFYYKEDDENIICRQATENDVSDMVQIYKKVFKTYPFPIYDEKYIVQTMNENYIYFGIWNKNKLVALSSIEVQKKYSNAEMTDFAVLPEYRGNNYAQYLLYAMENKLNDLGIKTAFTIARAKSAGMNITFGKSGYDYAGTLIKNTDIAGQIESMNVWYKYIS